MGVSNNDYRMRYIVTVLVVCVGEEETMFCSHLLMINMLLSGTLRLGTASSKKPHHLPQYIPLSLYT